MTPNPGSKEARAQGCTCPVVDNRYGKGWPYDGGTILFWRDEDCPLHGDTAFDRRIAETADEFARKVAPELVPYYGLDDWDPSF